MTDNFQSPFYLFSEDFLDEVEFQDEADYSFLDGNEFQDETQSSNFDTSASSTSVLVVDDLVDSSRFGDRFSDYLDRFNDVFSFKNASNLDQAKIGEIKDFLLGDFGGSNVFLSNEVIDTTDLGVDIITDFEIEINRMDFMTFSNGLTFDTLVNAEVFFSTEDPLEDFISVSLSDASLSNLF